MKKKRNAEWNRVCAALVRDSVRVRVPRAFLSALALLFHHVSDAMAGDDRPDHGLAMMRAGREHYRIPLTVLHGKLTRAEARMSRSHTSKALRLLHRYYELLEERDRHFRKRLGLRKSNSSHS